MEGEKYIQKILADAGVREFVVRNLSDSMTNIGFSQQLISEFLDGILTLDMSAFVKRHLH